VSTIEAENVAVWDGSSWASLGAGLNDTVNALLVHDGVLYAGGNFTSSGSVAAAGIARWSGGHWESVGTLPTESPVYALASYQGQIIAAGAFVTLGGNPVAHIGRWTGSVWEPLGDGFNDEVRTLAVWNGSLFAGGRFTQSGPAFTNRIARWNGEGWDDIGTGMVSGAIVYCLRPTASSLLAGGAFSTVAGMTARAVAKWNGSQWSSMGVPLTVSNIRALTEFEGQLVAGGVINAAPLVGAMRYDGTAWAPLGALQGESAWTRLVTVYNGHLIAGGDFRRAGPEWAAGIAQWNGADWVKMGPAVLGQPVQAVSATPEGLALAGDLVISGPPSTGVLLADRSGLRPLGVGLSGPGSVLCQTSSFLFAGGTFTFGGNTSRAARWDGTVWSPMGQPLDGPAGVMCACVHEGQLVIGGNFDFTIPPGVSCGRLARWSGTQWECIGQTDGDVTALASFDGFLYASGYFSTVSGVYGPKFARWNGAVWQGGLGNLDGPIRSFAVFGGKLVAAGSFITPGPGLAQFDGSVWTQLGTPNDRIDALAVYYDRLFATGMFTRINNVPMSHIAAWNGTQWSPLGSGLSPIGGKAMAVWDDQLHVGGQFTLAGDRATPYWATWSEAAPRGRVSPSTAIACGGNTVELALETQGVGPYALQWRRNGVALADGPTGSGSSISGATTGTLTITSAGVADAGAYDCRITRPGCSRSGLSSPASVEACYANCDCSVVAPTLNVLDFNCFLSHFAAGDPYANCDGSTTPPVLNVLDFNCFLSAFALGCP
jgi:hypothetical protein